MAKYRGSKGNLKISANSVANVKSWELEIERPYIEGTDLGDNGGTGTLDIPRARGRCTVELDYGDTAQKALLDMLVSNDDPTAVAGLFVVSGTGPKQISCNVLPTRATITQSIGQYVTAQIELVSDGAISLSWT